LAPDPISECYGHPFTEDDTAAGYRYDASIVQAEFSLTQMLDRPVTGRIFLEQMIRDNLDLGRPDKISLIFGRRIHNGRKRRYAVGRVRPSDGKRGAGHVAGGLNLSGPRVVDVEVDVAVEGVEQAERVTVEFHEVPAGLVHGAAHPRTGQQRLIEDHRKVCCDLVGDVEERAEDTEVMSFH
jgi:hypothetical protein